LKIAVISDIHDNFNNLLLALDTMRERGVEQILCLGDIINPGVAKILVDCGIPTFTVWGNNDGDKVTITKFSLAPGSSLEVGDKTYASLEMGGKKIFITHYPDLVGPIAASGLYDVVFYGHDHLKRSGQFAKCLIVNPGEVSGIKTREATFAVYDTDSNQVEIITLGESVSVRTDYVEAYFSEK